MLSHSDLICRWVVATVIGGAGKLCTFLFLFGLAVQSIVEGQEITLWAEVGWGTISFYPPAAGLAISERLEGNIGRVPMHRREDTWDIRCRSWVGTSQVKIIISDLYLVVVIPMVMDL
jgi:hypothetical protein